LPASEKSSAAWRVIVVGGHTRSIGKTQLVCDIISAFPHARRSFWLRTKQGFLAEGLPLLRQALHESPEQAHGEPAALIVESNSLLQFLKPSLYLAVIDPAKEDFKDSARAALDRADALVLRGTGDVLQAAEPAWMKLPARLLKEKPSVTQREGQPLPEPLHVLVQRALEAPARVAI
jgi:hypothetical protein